MGKRVLIGLKMTEGRKHPLAYKKVIYDFCIGNYDVNCETPNSHKIERIVYTQKNPDYISELKIRFQDGGSVHIISPWMDRKNAWVDANARIVGKAWSHKDQVPNHDRNVYRRLRNMDVNLRRSVKMKLPLEGKVLWDKMFDWLKSKDRIY